MHGKLRFKPAQQWLHSKSAPVEHPAWSDPRSQMPNPTPGFDKIQRIQMAGKGAHLQANDQENEQHCL